jgi:epoxyqueuosine reductase
MSLEAKDLILLAQSLGFSRLGVVNLDSAQDLSETMQRYREWLAKGYAGQMDYLARHANLRAQPHALLESDTPHLRAIVVTMDYLDSAAEDWRTEEARAVNDPHRAVVSIYARGRDYHKVLRTRLMRLADQLSAQQQGQFQFRACVDSAPVLEVELARRCGLGWRGKHTLLLNRQQGSLFFLGVLLTNMPLPETQFEPALEEAPQGHCGSCTSCMDLCPTQAFVGPFELDARRCISYLTIEHPGSIPENLRPLMGNRVYGCDDCQRVCPWNRYAQTARLDDFQVRHGLDQATLVTLFSWTEHEFTARHQGSAILRIGYLRWLRNLAVGMGNALASRNMTDQERSSIRAALEEKQYHESELVREHVTWALAQETVS